MDTDCGTNNIPIEYGAKNKNYSTLKWAMFQICPVDAMPLWSNGKLALLSPFFSNGASRYSALRTGAEYVGQNASEIWTITNRKNCTLCHYYTLMLLSLLLGLLQPLDPLIGNAQLKSGVGILMDDFIPSRLVELVSHNVVLLVGLTVH